MLHMHVSEQWHDEIDDAHVYEMKCNYVKAKHLGCYKDHLAAIQILKERGVKGSGIIGAYHVRRVAPLMAHALPLYQMVLEVSFKGMVLIDEALPFSEVA